MVNTSAPSSCSARTVQDLIALPLTCTTQAPHCEVSQPTCVPVSRRFSRSNCTSSVRGSMVALMGLPFTVIETVAVSVDATGLLPGNFRSNAAIRRHIRDRGRLRGQYRGDFAAFRSLEQELL